jgi:hypothetical protein
MKTKKKSKSQIKRPQLKRTKYEKPETYKPMETGQPDQDASPGSNNPAAVQGGRGPLNEEGEGDRQNDQLAELEQIPPQL